MTQHSKQPKNTSQPPALLLTRESRDSHCRIELDGQPLWLTESDFQTLCALVAAKTGGSSEFAHVERMRVSRLRHAIDEVAGSGAGLRLITSHRKQNYALTLPRSDIAIAPSFAAMPVADSASRDLKESILSSTRVWPTK
jgi:hypothetical protein